MKQFPRDYVQVWRVNRKVLGLMVYLCDGVLKCTLHVHGPGYVLPCPHLKILEENMSA